MTLRNARPGFGKYVRKQRLEQHMNGDRRCSVRGLAGRVGLEPSYLSKIEREKEAPPSEAKIRQIAIELGEDPDLLLGMAGKISTDLRDAILMRPKLFAQLIRKIKDMPDERLLRLV